MLDPTTYDASTRNPAVYQTLEYDPAHRLVHHSDTRNGAASKTLAYDWSPGGLLNRVEDSDGHRTDYLYDGVGRLIGIWAPNFDYLAFAHDAGGRLTEKWFPNGTTARYAWNPDDSLAELTNRTVSNSILTRHQYQYDTLGRRTRHAETIGSLGTKYLQYGFDALSRLTQSQTCATSAYGTCATDETLAYDIWDNRKTRTAAGATLAYVYDNAHQLKETRSGSDTGPLVASYAYDANGNLISRPGQTLAWTADNRLAGIGAETYAYDHAGRRIGKTVSGQSTSWLYNGPDIHAEWNATAPSGAPQAVYTHGPAWDDPLVRMTGATGGPDAVARYYHADGLGSAVALTGNGQTRVNAVRETGVALTEGSGGSYTVGGVASNVNTLKDGDRSAASGHWTVTSGRTLDIAFAGSREIEEVVLVGNPGLTGNPQPKETDTYAASSSFDVSTYTVQTWNGAAWVTQGTVTGNKNVIRHVSFAPVATTKVRIIPVDDASNGQTANDNVVSLAEVEAWTTPEGGGTQVQRFDAWGNKTQSAGAAIPQYGYTGREPDGTGLIYYRARYYDPTLGRFISRDPIGLQGGLNQFAYVGNNPVNFTDPEGLCPTCIWGGVAGAVGGFITGAAQDGARGAFIGTLTGFGAGFVVGSVAPALASRAGSLAAGAITGFTANLMQQNLTNTTYKAVGLPGQVKPISYTQAVGSAVGTSGGQALASLAPKAGAAVGNAIVSLIAPTTRAAATVTSKAAATTGSKIAGALYEGGTSAYGELAADQMSQQPVPGAGSQSLSNFANPPLSISSNCLVCANGNYSVGGSSSFLGRSK